MQFKSRLAELSVSSGFNYSIGNLITMLMIGPADGYRYIVAAPSNTEFDATNESEHWGFPADLRVGSGGHGVSLHTDLRAEAAGSR